MVRDLLHLHIISNHLHADICISLDVRVSIVEGAIIFFAFSIFGQNVLSDLHEVVQSLLIQLLGEASNDLFGIVTVDRNT